MRLKDRVVLVTGAASGIGRALCPLLAREGARLALLDRNAEGLASVSEELQALGTARASAQADVSKRDAVREAVATLTDQLGSIDILVACAGITGTTLLDDLNIDRTESIVRINLLGVAYTIDAVLPSMLTRGRGQIVALSSLAGRRGLPFSAAYGASKAGLAAYLEGLRPALRRRGIAVTTVFPGFVRTPLMESAEVQPPMTMMEPEMAAKHVLRAILKRKREYAFPLFVRFGVGFLSWLPASIYDWMMARGAARIPNLRY